MLLLRRQVLSRMITHVLADAAAKLLVFLRDHVGATAIEQAGVEKRLERCRSNLLLGLFAEARVDIAEAREALLKTHADAIVCEYVWMVDDLISRALKVAMESRLLVDRLRDASLVAAVPPASR